MDIKELSDYQKSAKNKIDEKNGKKHANTFSNLEKLLFHNNDKTKFSKKVVSGIKNAISHNENRYKLLIMECYNPSETCKELNREIVRRNYDLHSFYLSVNYDPLEDEDDSGKRHCYFEVYWI